MNTNFETVWDELNKPIKSYIRRRVNNDYDAEDILQIVFLKLLNNINNLKETNKLHAWVYTITKNAINDYYKKHISEVNIDDLSDEIMNEESEELIMNNEMAQCLKNIVQDLPEKYREAIILTEFQNLTQAELALKMGLSLSGAKSRVQRARTHLKEMLLDCCSLEKDHRGNIIDYKTKKNCSYCVKKDG